MLGDSTLSSFFLLSKVLFFKLQPIDSSHLIQRYHIHQIIKKFVFNYITLSYFYHCMLILQHRFLDQQAAH